MEELLEGVQALTLEASPNHEHHVEFLKIKDAMNALSNLDFGQMTEREKKMIRDKIMKAVECLVNYRKTDAVDQLREGRQHFEDAAGTWK